MLQGWCGANSYYCGGGCQGSYGSCVLPIIGLTYDADAGDSIWDVTTDNVFDAQVGDGIIYYGAGRTPIQMLSVSVPSNIVSLDPTAGWPS